MDYVQGGELFKYMLKRGRLEQEEAMKYFRQILSAMDYAHDLELCHRDLKPENMLIDFNGNIRIIDFGLGTRSSGKHLDLGCGSPHYTAPEVIRDRTFYDGRVADVWSAGVILYALLAGKLPFDGEYNTGLLDRIVDGQYTMLDFGLEMSDLISRMLEVNPDERITMKDIWRHPAVTKYAPRDGMGNETDRPVLPYKKDDMWGPSIGDPRETDKDILKMLMVLWDKRLSETVRLLQSNV